MSKCSLPKPFKTPRRLSFVISVSEMIVPRFTDIKKTSIEKIKTNDERDPEKRLSAESEKSENELSSID